MHPMKREKWIKRLSINVFLTQVLPTNKLIWHFLCQNKQSSVNRTNTFSSHSLKKESGVYGSANKNKNKLTNKQIKPIRILHTLPLCFRFIAAEEQTGSCSPERLESVAWETTGAREKRSGARHKAVRYATRGGLTYTRADVKLYDTSWPEQRRPVMRWLLVKSVWHFSVHTVGLSFHRLLDHLEVFIKCIWRRCHVFYKRFSKIKFGCLLYKERKKK